MKLETFLRKFRELASGRKWRMGGPVHATIRRAVKCDVCPLSFVASEIGLGVYKTPDWLDAAHDLGLDEDDAEDIAHAADNPSPLRDKTASIRRRLLSACGLKERSS